MSSSLWQPSKVRLQVAGLNDQYFYCSSYAVSNWTVLEGGLASDSSPLLSTGFLCPPQWVPRAAPREGCHRLSESLLLASCSEITLYKIFGVYILRQSETVSSPGWCGTVGWASYAPRGPWLDSQPRPRLLLDPQQGVCRTQQIDEICKLLSPAPFLSP